MYQFNFIFFSIATMGLSTKNPASQAAARHRSSSATTLSLTKFPPRLENDNCSKSEKALDWLSSPQSATWPTNSEFRAGFSSTTSTSTCIWENGNWTTKEKREYDEPLSHYEKLAKDRLIELQLKGSAGTASEALEQVKLRLMLGQRAKVMTPMKEDERRRARRMQRRELIISVFASRGCGG